jgi:hypothetical protein
MKEGLAAKVLGLLVASKLDAPAAELVLHPPAIDKRASRIAVHPPLLRNPWQIDRCEFE